MGCGGSKNLNIDEPEVFETPKILIRAPSNHVLVQHPNKTV